MDSLLSQVLKEICREYELDEQILTPIIKKLSNDFYLKLKDMKNLSFDLWKSFNLPSNLYYILNDKYQEACTQAQLAQISLQVSSKETKPKKPQQEQPKSSKTQKDQKERDKMCQSQVIKRETKLTLEKMPSKACTSKAPPISSEDIQTYLEIASVEIDNRTILKEILALIKQSLSNIVTNPTEDKYRKISIEKIISKHPYQSVTNLLELFLFKEVDKKFLLFHGEIKDLVFALSELALFVQSKNLVLEEYIPNQALEIPQVDFDQLYQEELKRRKNLAQKFKRERDPKLVPLTSSFTLSSSIMQMNQEEVVQFQTEENKLIIDKAINIINANSNDRFTVKSRSLYESLIKTPIILQSHLRLIFPDDKIIEAFFSIGESVGDIVAFIKECLINPKDEFILSTTPPPNKYTKLSQTIQELKLFPKVMMYVNFSVEYNKLKENLFASTDIQKSFSSNFTFNPNSNNDLIYD